MVDDAGHERASQKPGTLHTPTLRVYAVFLGILGFALATVWASPAFALPSFAAQTGLPCSACHVGAFGPQLTPFGISFRANGYTMGGGTGPSSQFPFNLFNLVVSPSFQTDATAQPTAPTGYGTNNFFNVLGSGTSVFIAGGHSFDGNFGIGGFEQWGLTYPPGGSLVGSEATSDLKLTKPLTLGNHSLLLGLDFTNTPSGGDPFNSLYNGFEFPYLTPFVGPTPAASPAISGLGTTVYGISLSGLYDNHFFAEAGLYQTWSTSFLNTMNIAPSSLGSIAGTAPYFRIAEQYTWGSSYLEIGGALMYIPLQLPGVPGQNNDLDWGLDATYEETIGPDTFTLTGNILFERQNLNASFAAGLSSNPSDWLDQFRIASSYYWNNTYGLTLAFTSTYGSRDPLVYAPAPLTGSANGSPNSQAIIAQIDWTPYGRDTTSGGYPWLNVRIGLQYTYYLRFNGGTTNYDGSGRNATDNNTLLLFTWWAF